jgi:RNA polymerase sigma factor (sigma-70 family)
MDLMTDGELVRRIVAGNTSDYGPLVQRWSARVLAVCHARVGRSAAEDLAQESLLRGLRSLATLSDPEKFGPWLIGIAVRTCLDWLKSAKRSEVSLDCLEAAGHPAGASEFAERADEPSFEHREHIDRLMRAIEELPLPYRETIMHYYYQRCTYQELADLLGVSAATINARLTKARAMLRERMLAEQE